MPGLLIYERYGMYYSYVIFDDVLYEMEKKELNSQPPTKVILNKDNLSFEQLDKNRSKVSEIVHKLNKGQKVDLKKELPDYF